MHMSKQFFCTQTEAGMCVFIVSDIKYIPSFTDTYGNMSQHICMCPYSNVHMYVSTQ